MFLFFDWFVVDEETEIKIRNKRIVQKADGTKVLVDKYLPINKHLKLVFDSIAKAADAKSVISENDTFWFDLSNAVKVRNRIVHPKTSKDFFISDDEISLVHNVGIAFVIATCKLLKKRAEADIKLANIMREAAKKKFGQQE